MFREGGNVDRRVARTKKNIYEAFFTLLQKKAMHDITVTELAKAADIDRKTFYAHYQTVQDVYLEFKQGVYDAVMRILGECEERGLANQAKLDAGEELARAEDLAPFDFVHFYDELNKVMTDNLSFFEKLSKDTNLMFLKNDFKNVLKQALIDYSQDDPNWPPYKLSVYSEFIAAGAINMWTDWLHHKPVPLEEFRDTAIEVLRDSWKMGG